MTSETISRDGLPPIVFIGENIGYCSSKSSTGSNQNRWVDVSIWRTKGGKFVASVVRHTQWEGESDRYTATAEESAKGIIDWLKDEDGMLGKASQRAVEDAVEKDESFKAAWVEVVD